MASIALVIVVCHIPERRRQDWLAPLLSLQFAIYQREGGRTGQHRSCHCRERRRQDWLVLLWSSQFATRRLEKEVGLASTALVIVVCHTSVREGGRTGQHCSCHCSLPHVGQRRSQDWLALLLSLQFATRRLEKELGLASTALVIVVCHTLVREGGGTGQHCSFDCCTFSR